MGGLGNQLFQIFATIAFSIQHKKPFRFTQAEKLGEESSCTVRMTYWNTFLSSLRPFITNDFPAMKIIRENGHHYTPISIEEVQDVDICLFGYFQSYYYFKEHFSTICRMIHLEEKKRQVLEKSKYDSSNAISLHFRLGDYKHLPHCHPIMSYEYYESALRYIDEHTIYQKNVIYFCENEDLEEVQKTIKKLQQKFANYSFVRGSEELDDWEQMVLMSCCQHNIIANSTFSWWGAYFNTNANKITIYPSVWFGPAIHAETKDMYPPEWIKI
jgi:hypothetical protein